jgi:hypothetical protein
LAGVEVWRSEHRRALDEALHRLAIRPPWLMAVLDPERLVAALDEAIGHDDGPRPVRCRLDRLFLRNREGRWSGRCVVTVASGGAALRDFPILVTVTAPGCSTAATPGAPGREIGAAGWACELVELGARCESMLHDETAPLPGVAALASETAAVAVLEPVLGPGLVGCEVEVLSDKPGRRCTMRARLRWDRDESSRPRAVILKAYDDDEGLRSHRVMEALRSSVHPDDGVALADSLAYVPELRLGVQSVVPGDESLEAVIRDTVLHPSPARRARLSALLRACGRGIASVHRSGASADEAERWSARSADVDELLRRLSVLADPVVEPLAALHRHLDELAAAAPEDPAVPSHGSFDADQVVVAGSRIGFVDFDRAGLAEPAVDVGHFRASLVDSGARLVAPAELHDVDGWDRRFAALDASADDFLHGYRERASVSTTRLVLWDAIDRLRDALQLWTKPTAAPTAPVVAVLAHHLRQMGLLAEPVRPAATSSS